MNAQPLYDSACVRLFLHGLGIVMLLNLLCVSPVPAAEPVGPEETLRALVRANAERDLAQRIILPLRETDVLERRNGRWILVAWHESTRYHGHDTGRPADTTSLLHRASDTLPAVPNGVDLSGQWEVTEVEDNKKYVASLDAQGNGPYTWQEGQFATTSFDDRRWQGTWKQTGNDREGAFEVVLSEDGTEARGIWWYVRVGTRNNIPPRQHGGTYQWKRLTPPPPAP